MIARACDVPRDGVLQAYVGRGATYTDCFEVMSPLEIPMEDFIEAFYTTWLFRLERVVLSAILRRRIADADVVALAQEGADFAAWHVEARREGQLLLADTSGHTRSYLAISPKQGGVTRLIFGSAIVARGDAPLGRMVTAVIPFHRFYSKCLLRLAERKLRHG